MWSELDGYGLTGKKLAVFDEGSADSIAQQLCRKLGIICEQLHVELVRTWIFDAHRSEPLAKRLRGDVLLDPLTDAILQDRKNLSAASSSMIPMETAVKLDELSSKPCRRRPQGEEEAQARKHCEAQ